MSVGQLAVIAWARTKECMANYVGLQTSQRIQIRNPIEVRRVATRQGAGTDSSARRSHPETGEASTTSKK